MADYGQSALQKMSQGIAAAAENGFKQENVNWKVQEKKDVRKEYDDNRKIWQDTHRQELAELEQMSVFQIVEAVRRNYFKTLRCGECKQQLYNIASAAGKEAQGYYPHRYESQFASEKYKEQLKIIREAEAAISALAQPLVSETTFAEGFQAAMKKGGFA